MIIDNLLHLPSGIDKEFEEVKTFFDEIIERKGSQDSTILDLSCGSGFMTRRLLQHDKFVHSLLHKLTIASIL